MHWQYNPYVLPLLVAAAVSAAIAFFAWRRRPAPGATPLSYLMLAATEWSLGYALGMASADLPAKIFWAKIQYFGIVAVPVMWLILSRQYTNRKRPLARRHRTLLAVIPLLTLLLVWTNESHGLIWSDTRLDTDQPFSVLYLSYGAFFWVWVSYSYLLILLGSILLLQAIVRSPYLYRQQAVALLIAALAPWAGNVLRISGWNPFPHLDLTNFAFTLSGLAAAWALFRFRLLDIVPVARDTVIEDMRDGVIVLDVRHRIVDINLAAQQIIGQPAVEAIGRPATEVLSGRLPEVVIGCFRDEKETQEEIDVGEGEARRRFDMRISQLRDQRGHLTGYLVVLRDITGRKRAEEIIKHMAYHDDLTDLPNRRLFEDRLNLARTQAHRNGQKLAVMLLDLDHFKDVNDTLGHNVGDQLLQAVGDRLIGLLRKGDTIARMGGDEFMLLLPEIARMEDAAKVAQKILEAFREPFVFDGHELHVTTSIGVAIYPNDGRDVDALTKNADIAMYRAKYQGRDNYQCYTPTGITLEKDASNLGNST